MFGARSGDTGRIAFLKSIVTDQMGRHLASEAHDWHGIHQRICQTRNCVGRAGPRGDKNNANLPRRSRIAFRRMHSTAFLPNEDMLEVVLFEKRIVNRQDSAARIAEYDFNTKVCQSLDDDFRACHVFASHVASVPS